MHLNDKSLRGVAARLSLQVFSNEKFFEAFSLRSFANYIALAVIACLFMPLAAAAQSITVSIEQRVYYDPGDEINIDIVINAGSAQIYELTYVRDSRRDISPQCNFFRPIPPSGIIRCDATYIVTPEDVRAGFIDFYIEARGRSRWLGSMDTYVWVVRDVPNYVEWRVARVTTVTSSPNPSIFGESVTVSYDVSTTGDMGYGGEYVSISVGQPGSRAAML